MTYTRQAFRAWLESLPADEPFCKTFCPIATWQGGGLSGAIEADYPLARAIDERVMAQRNKDVLNYGDWRDIEPREVLQIITDLEAA